MVVLLPGCAVPSIPTTNPTSPTKRVQNSSAHWIVMGALERTIDQSVNNELPVLLHQIIHITKNATVRLVSRQQLNLVTVAFPAAVLCEWDPNGRLCGWSHGCTCQQRLHLLLRRSAEAPPQHEGLRSRQCGVLPEVPRIAPTHENARGIARCAWCFFWQGCPSLVPLFTRCLSCRWRVIGGGGINTRDIPHFVKPENASVSCAAV